MPTTFTGLLLFVVLLLPGFAYLVGKERAGTERRASPFRETVAIVAASISAELAVVLISALLWTRHVSLRRLMRDPEGYLDTSPGLLAGWSAGLLLAATALAYLATWPSIRRGLGRITPRVVQAGGHTAYPHPSAVSGWWLMFEHHHPGMTKHVGLQLDDGSAVSGDLLSFNNDASDSGDRDIVLVAPIEYRAAGESDQVAYPTSMVAVPARRIVAMFVTVVEETDDGEAPAVPGTQPS
ncbi:DUF6338 family protein [Kribbella sp. NBC_01505]|uniref:DUF6338 family protein n=1 Tax=Kribbella sp. NBC_01505 TaxID=2903580 RepID=UPI00386A433B